MPPECPKCLRHHVSTERCVRERDVVEVNRPIDPLAERIRETLVAVRNLAPDALSNEKVETTASLVARGIRDLGGVR